MESTVHIAAFDALKAENGVLLQRADAAEKEAGRYRKKLVATEEQLAQLSHELSQLKRLVFGVRSERFVLGFEQDQLPLFGGAPAQDETPALETVTYTKRKNGKPKRQALPSHLPREVIVIEPDVDTTDLKRIGEEITETLDYHPGTLTVIQRIRPKYVDPLREERGVVIGALPARPVERGIAEASLLSHVVIEKYADHLPIYRQVERFKREGITLATSTLGGWVKASADLVAPLYRALCEEVLASEYIQADETPIRVQDRNKKGKTHKGFYWVYHAPRDGLVVMDYQRGRSARDGPTQFLVDYKGSLQSDGYQVYDEYDKKDENGDDKYEDVTTYNCLAHARRHFFDAKGNAPELAEHAINEIRQLYAIERELREGDSSPEERQRMRRVKAVPILKRFKAWLEANRGLPKSPWGKAVYYSLARWEKLSRYTEDGRIEIDTNLVENAIRPIAIGRKNYLFAGSHDAAQRAAVIYSLLATCKKNDVNPQLWLTDVLSRIPTHPAKRVNELLPHRWENSKV